MEREAHKQAERVQKILDAVKDQCQRTSVRQYGKQAGVDEANLAHVLSGRRKPSQVMLAKLQATLEHEP